MKTFFFLKKKLQGILLDTQGWIPRTQQQVQHSLQSLWLQKGKYIIFFFSDIYESHGSVASVVLKSLRTDPALHYGYSDQFDRLHATHDTMVEIW